MDNAEMVTLKDFMEATNYKITEGSDFCWSCFGPNAYSFDSWNQQHDGYSANIVFDTRTHVVYQVAVYDYSRNRAYRLINPNFKNIHQSEGRERDVNIDQAWDDVTYIDLETKEDFLEKTRAIVTGMDYDTKVELPILLSDHETFLLMKMAHEKDITLNQLVEEILLYEIEMHK